MDRIGTEEPPQARPMIRNTSTVSVRFELPRHTMNGKMLRPCLLAHVGKGSAGLPFRIWCFTKCRVRGAFTTDWNHNMTNMCKMAT